MDIVSLLKDVLAHVPVAHIENKGVSVPVFVLASLTLGAVPREMAIHEQINNSKCFNVFKVSGRRKLHVTFSIEGCGKGELKKERELMFSASPLFLYRFIVYIFFKNTLLTRFLVSSMMSFIFLILSVMFSPTGCALLLSPSTCLT